MTTGLEKLFEAREKCIDEPLRTPITLRALGPIEHYEGTAHCEGRDFLAGLNQPRIIAGRKSRWQIGFGEFAFERNGEEMETPLTLLPRGLDGPHHKSRLGSLRRANAHKSWPGHRS